MSTLDSIEQELDAELEAPRRRRKRRLLWLTLAAVVAGGGAGGYWWYTTQHQADETPTEQTGPAATTEVTKETIADTETWGGTLGHGDPFTVTAAGSASSPDADPAAGDSGSGGGTITRIADPDATVTRGTELYRLDEKPVIALLGNIPMYRDLTVGDTGIDVKQLEKNLRALGYGGFTVDDEYSYATADAVEEWQDDLGADETGSVRTSDVVFVPDTGRVENVHADVGTAVSAGTEILDITGSEEIVSFDVDVVDADLAEVGTDVTVTLPNGKDFKGTVTAAEIVESSGDSGDDAPGGDEDAGADDATTEVEVTLKKQVDDSFIGSPVDVHVKVDEKKDVLVVPVNALLALSEGGYGLEVVSADGSSSIEAVDTGLFADGKVEVSGDAISEGTVVGVAGR